MPIFSEFEKQIIKHISDMDATKPQIFGCSLSSVMFKSKDCALYLAMGTNNYLSQEPIAKLYCQSEKASIYSRSIITLISLIKYLEQNQYICIFPNATHVSNLLFNEDSYSPDELSYDSIINGPGYETTLNNNKGKHIIRYKNNHVDTSEILYTEQIKLDAHGLGYMLYGEIERIFASYVYPTDRLVQLVKDNFKDAQELAVSKQLQEANNQTRYAFLAVVISLVTLVASIIIPAYTSSEKEILDHAKSIDSIMLQHEKIIVDSALLNMNLKSVQADSTKQ
jgi:hypothetical protein